MSESVGERPGWAGFGPAPGAADAEGVTPSAGLSPGLKLLYGLGEIPITVTMALIGLFVLFFYNSVMRLPATLAGAGVTASLVFDALVDPYIGHRSDRFQHSLGRRHPFMLLGALGMGPCFFLLFSPPRDLGTAKLFLWLLVCSVAFRASSALYRIPYLSLGAELSSDYDERTGVIVYRSLLGLAGMAGAAALSFLLFFPAGPGGGDPKLSYDNYPRLGMAFGAVMTLSGLAAFFGTLSHRSRPTRGPSRPAGEFVHGLVLTAQDGAFRALWLSFTVFYLAVVLNASLAVHYFTWYVRLRGGGTLSAIQACFYAGAFAGVAGWLWLARRGEKRFFYVVACLSTTGLLCAATFLFGEGTLFGTGKAFPLLLGHGVAGLAASALWVLPYSMMADYADHDELRTGLRREGICLGIMNLGEKIAAGGALLLAGVMLHHYIRLTPNAEYQSPGAIARIGICYGLVSGVLVAAAGALALFYRLDRTTVRAIQERLAQRRLDSAACGEETGQP